MNLRPSGYEPDELPDCSTPHPADRKYIAKDPVFQGFVAEMPRNAESAADPATGFRLRQKVITRAQSAISGPGNTPSARMARPLPDSSHRRSNSAFKLLALAGARSKYMSLTMRR